MVQEAGECKHVALLEIDIHAILKVLHIVILGDRIGVEPAVEAEHGHHFRTTFVVHDIVFKLEMRGEVLREVFVGQLF